MNLCERAREVLPGLAAGEPDDEGVLSHLAACADCREAEDAMVREVAALRAGLAPLAPSPELEEDVLESAREARPRFRREPRAVSWAVALPALAAVVVAGFLLPRWFVPAAAPPPGERALGEPPKGADRLPTAVVSPSTDAEIAASRAANRPSLAEPRETLAGGEMLAEALWGIGEKTHGVLRRTVREFPAPEAGNGVHRWVYGDAGAIAGKRRWAVGAGPMLGVVLGIGILGGSLASEQAAAGGWFLKSDARRVVIDPGQEFEVVLASPDGGTEARVLAHFEHDFSGALWVPPALARALSLHQFEIPGGATAEEVVDVHTTTEVVGQRARVKVAIPVLDHEALVEAFVPTPDSVPFSGDEVTHVLTFEGVEPIAVFHDVEDGGQDVFEDLWAAMARTSASDAPSVVHRVQFGARGTPGVLLRHGGAGFGTFAYLGRIDPGSRRLRGLSMVLAGPFPPFARAVLARVWNGRIAIPSGEAVSMAEVAPDGSLSIFRCYDPSAREARGPLRMRLTTQEGVVSWHEVALDGSVDARVFAHLRVDATGTVALHHVEPASGRLWQDEGLWDVRGSRDARAGLEALLVALVGVAANPALTDERGASRARLVVEAEPSAPWGHVAWALDLARRDDVRVRHVSLRTTAGGPAFDLDLEAARASLAKPPASGTRVVVSLLEAVDATAHTEVSMARMAADGTPNPPDGSSARIVLPHLGVPDEGRSAFESHWAEALRAQPWAAGARSLAELHVAHGVPYEDVRLVLRALRAAGAGAFAFRPAP